jgi:hypothetical protein
VVANKTKSTKEKKLGGHHGNGWKPGQSGNPKGRPKKQLDRLYEFQDRLYLEKEELWTQLIERMRQGDTKSIEIMLSYLYGKPLQPIEGSLDTGDIKIVVEYVNNLPSKTTDSP